MKQEKYIQNDEMVKLIRIFLIIVVVFMLFYALTVTISNKKNKPSIENNNVDSIQYTEILLGTIFNKKENSYYVLAEFKDEEKNYSSYINEYNKTEDALNIYYVDMNDAMNSKYINDEENITNDISDLKISKTTLFKIENGQIVEHYSGNEKILEYFEKVTK